MSVEWAKLLLTLVTTVATAVWALIKWREQRNKELLEREKQHQLERRRLSALYVNPFLLACEELQSRLYNILAKAGLSALNLRHPDGSYAEETLYLIVQYFGWQRCVYRYYYDPPIIELMERIRSTFATDKFGVGAFCFYRPEQRSLGEIIMLRTEGQYGFEFEAKGYTEFLNILESLRSFKSIQETLEALRGARTLSDLPRGVCRRLVEIQILLVALLNYIEEKEGITFNPSKGGGRLMASKEVCGEGSA